MEKIKDFLYDISDLFLSLLIIGIIFIAVSWKLSDTMRLPWFDKNPIRDYTSELIKKDQESTLPSKDPIVDVIEIEEPIVEVEDKLVIEDLPIVDVKFEVPSGAPGYKVAKLLKENNLISDIDEFLNTLDELKLGNKVRAGTHKLNTGMTTREIIKVLTGS